MEKLEYDIEVADNPLFTSAPRNYTSKAERIFATALHSAEMAQRMGLPITAGGLWDVNKEIPERLYSELLQTQRFQNALEDRGIALPSATGLSHQQLSALAIYTNMSVPANHAQRLKLAGVTEARWRGWLRQRAFSEQLAQLSEETLKDAQPMMLQRVTEAIDAGQRWAIELGLEVTGRHDRRKETVDVNMVLMAIFGILDEEVADVAVLQRISGRVKAMMGAGAAPVLQITPAARKLDDLEPEIPEG